MKRTFKRALALVISLAMCLSMVSMSAMAVSYEAPSSGIEVDDNVLTGATAAANTVVLSVLGINVTASNGAGVYNSGGSTSAYGTDSSNLGIFGSDINDNPDPYLYNFFYNIYTTQSGTGDYDAEATSEWTATPFTLLWSNNKSGPTGGASGTTTITVAGVTKTTNPAFFYEPDILLGGASDGYATELANYQSEYNSDYNPTVFLGYGTSSGQYAASGTRSDGLGLEYNMFDMTKGVVYLGAVVQNLMNETGKVNRYDEGAYEIAVNYDKYDRGLYYYVLSEIAEGNLTQVRYASSLSYDSDTGYYTVGQGTGRNAQYASGIGIDIYDLLEAGYVFEDGTVVEKTTTTSSSSGDQGGMGGQGGQGGSSSTSGYQLTTDQLIEILNAPAEENDAATGVVIGSSSSSVDPTGDLTEAGIRFLNNLPSCVYGMTMQTVENGMGIPYYIGFFYYDQDSSLNPVNYIYYWMENFYHVSDNDSMELVVANMLESADLPSGLILSDKTTSGYSATTIEAQIVSGIEYYQNVLEPEYEAMVEDGTIESDSALFWTSLDTSVGIGSTVRQTNVNYTCESGESITDSYGNVIYSFTWTSINGDDDTQVEDPTEDAEEPTEDAEEAEEETSELSILRQIIASLSEQYTDEETASLIAAMTDIAAMSAADTKYYGEAITWAIQTGVSSGKSSTSFDPSAGCTRAEFVQLLYAAAGSPSVEGMENPFTDVKSGSWYYNAVVWAYNVGVCSGKTATTFDPTAVCTRAEMASFLYQADGSPSVSGLNNPFTDVTGWATKSITWAYNEKVTSGTSATTFSPSATCTRAQVVTFLYNLATAE